MKSFYSIIFICGLLFLNNCNTKEKGNVGNDEKPTPSPQDVIKINDSKDEDPPSVPTETMRKKMFKNIIVKYQI